MTIAPPRVDAHAVSARLAESSRLWKRVLKGDQPTVAAGDVSIDVRKIPEDTYEMRIAAGIAPDPADRATWLTLMASSAVAEAVRGDIGVAVWSVWPDRLIAPDGQVIATVSVSLDSDVTRIVFDAVIASDGRPFTDSPAALEQYAAQRPAVESLAFEVLQAFERLYLRWTDFARRPGPSGLLADYGSCCGSIKVEVEVELHGGSLLRGIAERIDLDGRLVLRHEGRLRPLDPGDVAGVRPLAVLPA